jgi:hypothetical protein
LLEAALPVSQWKMHSCQHRRSASHKPDHLQEAVLKNAE